MNDLQSHCYFFDWAFLRELFLGVSLREEERRGGGGRWEGGLGERIEATGEGERDHTLMAFVTKLNITCRSRSGSPRTYAPSFGTFTKNCICFTAA